MELKQRTKGRKINVHSALRIGLSVLLFSLPLAACKDEEVPSDTMFIPAEWEEHEAVWMAWPTYQNKQGRPSEEVQAEMIKAMIPHVKIKMVAYDEAEIPTIKSYLESRGISPAIIESGIEFHAVPHGDLWFRDTGPTFLINERGEQKILDGDFSTWGYDPYVADEYQAESIAISEEEEAVDRTIASHLNLHTTQLNMIFEGGALEFNGKGTVITTEEAVLSRNPLMTKAQVEAELKRVFSDGAKKIIWLPNGVGSDSHAVEKGPYTINGTLTYTTITPGGHTDEFVRFIDDHTVLLAEVSEVEAASNPVSARSRIAMEEAYHILSHSTNQSGVPIEVIRVPEAPLLIEQIVEGDGTYDYLATMDWEARGLPAFNPGGVDIVLATSYLNYFVTNGVVLVAKYWTPGRDITIQQKDEAARQALSQAFPGRIIVQINPENLNICGGGMHCITKEEPKMH